MLVSVYVRANAGGSAVDVQAQAIELSKLAAGNVQTPFTATTWAWACAQRDGWHEPRDLAAASSLRA